VLSFSIHVLKVEIDLIMNECDRYIIVSKYLLGQRGQDMFESNLDRKLIGHLEKLAKLFNVGTIFDDGIDGSTRSHLVPREIKKCNLGIILENNGGDALIHHFDTSREI